MALRSFTIFTFICIFFFFFFLSFLSQFDCLFVQVAYTLMTNNTIGDASNEICTVNLDGSDVQQITHNDWDDWFPTYSACGDLMYVSQQVVDDLICVKDLIQMRCGVGHKLWRWRVQYPFLFSLFFQSGSFFHSTYH